MRIPPSVLRVACLVAGLAIVSGARAEAPKGAPPNPRQALLKPELAKDRAPDRFQVKFETSKGTFVIEVTRAWSPLGADRFYNLARAGYYDGIRFFRVVPNFVVQFGLHGEPAVSQAWSKHRIQDDPVKESNTKGTVTYAKSGPNTRTTQVFVNLGDNSRLDEQGFSPFGKIVEGLDVVEKLNGEYGDTLTKLQGKIVAEGNAFLAQRAPKLDFIKKATIVR